MLFGMASCSDSHVVDEFKPIRNNVWNYEDIQSLGFSITSVESRHNILLNLRITPDYQYSNIQVKYTLTDPKGRKVSKLVDLLLADKKGKWLGSGIGDVITYQLPLDENIKLKEIGDYSINLEQYMRIDNLIGVKEVGAKVNKGKKYLIK